jgi:hypothetical protein
MVFYVFLSLNLTQKEEVAKLVFEAAEHLTFMSNVTQLGLTPKKEFKIRHGISYEKDALLMKIHSTSKTESTDIIGRAVVLAFRLAGIQAKFPSIVTVKELTGILSNKFVAWKPTVDEKLKFFKGQKFGTKSIMVSSDKKRKPKSINSAKRNAIRVINNFESQRPLDAKNPVSIFVNKMYNSPSWCQEIIKKEASFVQIELLETLKKIVAILENTKNEL